eukprot:3938933-Rhodomonas_salina.3
MPKKGKAGGKKGGKKDDGGATSSNPFAQASASLSCDCTGGSKAGGSAGVGGHARKARKVSPGSAGITICDESERGEVRESESEREIAIEASESACEMEERFPFAFVTCTVVTCRNFKKFIAS